MAKPVRFADAETVYRGPTPEIGDLWCQRVAAGHIRTVWELSDEERSLIAAGGRLELDLFNEPIPPIALNVLPEEASRPVGEHDFKVIPELEERHDG